MAQGLIVVSVESALRATFEGKLCLGAKCCCFSQFFLPSDLISFGLKGRVLPSVLCVLKDDLKNFKLHHPDVIFPKKTSEFLNKYITT